MMTVGLGVLLSVVVWVPVYFAVTRFVTDGTFSIIITAKDFLSHTIKFTPTGLTAQSLCYPQIILITASVKITAAILLCASFFSLDWVCHRGLRRQNKKEKNTCK
jgi:hypothetical protein